MSTPRPHVDTNRNQSRRRLVSAVTDHHRKHATSERGAFLQRHATGGPKLSEAVSATEDRVESPGTMEVGNVNSTTAEGDSVRQKHGKPSGTAQEASLGIVTRLPKKQSSSSADSQSPNTTTLNPIANNNEARKALHVPNEIFFMILRLLPLKDRLSIWLVSKPFSEVGAGTIFRTFVFKPNRDDFARMKAVAARPHLVAGIKSIRFESGTIDIYHIIAELAIELSPGCNDMLWGLAEYKCSQTRKRSAILEYAQWNSA
ncbi:hypothetical protein IFR04_014596 [Cadophora malorum]|uniref:F-box domain-containing protein n=1 Tax=Cadophora malorum TaxID=108018 RepID=A0A8H7W080_9HELO|nr:hypothetical protein IFR04_014596 [Cadophora malorum]